MPAKAQQVNAETPDLLEPHRPKKPGDEKLVTRVNLGDRNDASYAHARLRRDRPDIFRTEMRAKEALDMLDRALQNPTGRPASETLYNVQDNKARPSAESVAPRFIND
jgi:hypothetical protein